MKKYLSIALAFLLTLSMLPAGRPAHREGEDYASCQSPFRYLAEKINFILTHFYTASKKEF